MKIAITLHDFGLYLLYAMVCGVLIGYMLTTAYSKPQAVTQFNADARYLLECNGEPSDAYCARLADQAAKSVAQ